MHEKQLPFRPTSASTRSGLTLALTTTALEALQPLVLVLAYQLGASNLVNGHNPINFCNGLLFGNAFSLVALLLVRAFKPQHRQRIAREKDRAQWSGVVAVQSLVPITCNVLLEVGLVIALSRVSAVEVSLIVACTAIALMLWECLDHREVPGAIPTMGTLLVGLSAWIAIGPDQDTAMREQMHAIGTNLIANTTTGNNILLALILLLSILYFRLSERFTQKLGALSYSIWQTSAQTFIFFVWATITFGLPHIYDLRSPLLWQVMLIYGGLISTAYTLLESAALANAGGTLVALCEGFLPFASGIFAWLLLKEPLTFSLVLSCVIAGMGLIMIEASNKRVQK